MPEKIKALVSEIRSIDGRIAAINNTAQAEGRKVTPHEQQQLDSLLDAFAAKEEAIFRAGEEPPSDLLSTKSLGRQTEPADLRGSPRSGGRSLIRPQGNPRLFADLFPDAKPDSGGWRDLREFVAALHNATPDHRFQPVSAQREGVGEDGGFFIPAQFFGGLLDGALESEVIRPLAQTVPLNSNVAEIPIWDFEDNSTAVGGFVGNWMGEGETATDQTGKSRRIGLRAKKLGIFSKVSNELLEDSALFVSQLETALMRSISWHMDLAFFTGDGAGKPKGVLNDNALIVQSKETGQSADTIQFENLTKMFARLHPASVSRSVWVANPTTIPELTKLAIRFQNAAESDFVGGSHVPVIADGSGNMTILTRPVRFSEKLPALGDEGDIILADFSQYLIGMRRVATVQRSIHEHWQSDESSFRVILRVDGQGTWSKPFTPRNGNTLSWIVTLAERA